MSVEDGIEFFKGFFHPIVCKNSSDEIGFPLTGMFEIILIVFVLADGIRDIGSRNDDPTDDLIIDRQKCIEITVLEIGKGIIDQWIGICVSISVHVVVRIVRGRQNGRCVRVRSVSNSKKVFHLVAGGFFGCIIP